MLINGWRRKVLSAQIAEATPKPVLYLDIDGVLWDVDVPIWELVREFLPRGANGIQDFMDFALSEFEVRWCTTWAPLGYLAQKDLTKLAAHTGIGEATWSKVQRSKGWRNYKYENLNEAEHLGGRPFAWVEDGLVPAELLWLAERDWLPNYLHTDVFENPDALIQTTEELKRWLGAL